MPGDTPTGHGPGGNGAGDGATGTTPEGNPGDELSQKPKEGGVSDETTADGMIYVGGLSAQHHWSINPFGGSLVMSVSIRNASPDPVNAVAVFSVNHFFGGQVGWKDKVSVLELEPGESRVITGRVDRLAQWTLVMGKVSVSRLEDHDAWGLGTVTRDRWVLFFPWFLALIAAMAVSFAVRRRRRQRLLHPADESGPGVNDESGLGEDDLGPREDEVTPGGGLSWPPLPT